ncbi:hypothetical protein PV10_04119 [Exophiala mesophila]|uniref:Uncharacterized protein n=1 Tax=Exophiala mesophila TaxID=212818 RepID=A0A0D1WUD0_EXOME|nr:uncharacterized protein PV10_04119 [Exophiala mesophila]KIV92855.1 hypothetical protein PV10_04119 [Exophiala mesophila]
MTFAVVVLNTKMSTRQRVFLSIASLCWSCTTLAAATHRQHTTKGRRVTKRPNLGRGTEQRDEVPRLSREIDSRELRGSEMPTGHTPEVDLANHGVDIDHPTSTTSTATLCYRAESTV